MENLEQLKKDFKKKSLYPINLTNQGNSLAVQGLGLCALTAQSPGSIPGQGTKIPQAVH